jgi:hypothetical protein
MPALLAVTAISGLPYNHTSFKPWAPASSPVTKKNVNPTKQIRSSEFNFIGERSLNALVKMNRNDLNPKRNLKRIGLNLKRSWSKSRMKNGASCRMSAGRNMLNGAQNMLNGGCCILSGACYTKSGVCYTMSGACYTKSAGCCLPIEVSDTLT